jgi:hypothetical protein
MQEDMAVATITRHILDKKETVFLIMEKGVTVQEWRKLVRMKVKHVFILLSLILINHIGHTKTRSW